MDLNIIDKQLSVVEHAFGWTEHVPNSEQLEFKKKLINIRRELKKIRYAVSEPCSTAAFGESQMGKSYLVSAMLSTPSHPFAVTDGKNQYDFISEINPSMPNSTIEATGVITRFTTQAKDHVPSGFLKVQLLSIPDIILILCEAFYNQVDYVQEKVLPISEINDYLDNIVPEKPHSKKPLLDDDEVLDIKEYLSDKRTVLHKKCSNIIDHNSNFFNFLISNLTNLSETQLSDILQILWNRDKYIGQLWTDMISTYKMLSYESCVYARFDAVLKRKGTLLDVARLDEMYGEPEDQGSEYEPFTEVKTSAMGNSIKIKKSFFSSLIAELSFSLPIELVESHPFLKDLDILDFPGARRPEQIQQKKLGEGKNLSTVLRRGKVSYLFNKYSAAKRISTLLFCHNNSMSGESSMGGLLDKWVYGNVGEDPSKREDFVQKSSISPLFIIGTWFNKDLEYQDEIQGDMDRLNARWNRRFNVVLEKEVLKSLGDELHWFNNWTSTSKAFQNIYMLRDFKYSRTIYHGYDPSNGTSESGDPLRPSSYQMFFRDLKQSFLSNDFVKSHFSNPDEAWESAASCAKDGTIRIINSLNMIAPNVSTARNDKFNADIKKVSKEFKDLLELYYHPDTSDEQLKLAKKQAGSACLHLDRLLGRDTYAFGRLMDTMMVSESEIFELVHSQLLGEEQPLPMSDEETRIFMSAGLDSTLSREENVERLCDYCGVDDEDECKEMLADIDIDKLLSQNQMMAGKADKLVESVEAMWRDKVLMTRTIQCFEDTLPSISTMMASMWNLYSILNVRKAFVEKVREYMTNIDKEVSVGIISDYLSMQFNRFTSSFGYDFFSVKDKEKLTSKNKELRLNIDESLLDEKKSVIGISLLSDLYKQKELLSGNSFAGKDKQFLARFPQFKRVWRWEQQLRSAFIFASELPDYDVKANTQLKSIIDELK